MALVPNAWRPRHTLAKTYEAMGELDRAAEELQRALELCPGHPDVTNDLASYWLRRSAPARAEVVLRLALPAHGENAGLHLNLALALTLLGREREALDHAEQAAAAKEPELAEQGVRLRARRPARRAA